MLTYSSWIEEKSALAQALKQGSCGGTYADAAIVLCTSISAMASLKWIKTKRTDRKRFIEIVARSRRDGIDSTMVSAPLLAQGNSCWKQKVAVSEIAFRYTGDNDISEN
jgi:hypothetical protein